MNIENEIWIGLVGLRPLIEGTILGNNKGAYTNLLLLAKNYDDFKSKALIFMYKINLEIFEFDEIEIFSERIKNNEVDKKLLHLAKLVKQNNNPQFSNLHIYNEYT
jgi:hypothetical protein